MRMWARTRVVAVALIALLWVVATDAQAQEESSLEPPPPDTVVIHTAQERIGNFGSRRTDAILYVSVVYGQKNLGTFLDEATYAGPRIPNLFRDRLIQALMGTGFFGAVKVSDATGTMRTGGYFAEVVLNPSIDLINSSKAAGVGTLGVYALFGGQLTTQFKLTTGMAVESIGNTGRRLLVRDSYDVSGLATSTVYKEKENVAKAWGRVIDTTVPHLANVITRAALEEHPERREKGSSTVVEDVPRLQPQKKQLLPWSQL